MTPPAIQKTLSPVAPATGKKGSSPAAPAAGRARASHKARAGHLFISANTYRRVPLFRYRRPREIVFENLEFYRREYAFQLHAYVLMPNHFHLLINFPSQRNLVDFLRDFKSAIGIQVVEWLKADNRKKLLSRLAVLRASRRHKDARYSVWQRDSYITPLLSARIIRQKFRYIHENPVRAGLVVVPEDYLYSSARVYAGRGQTDVGVDLIEVW